MLPCCSRCLQNMDPEEQVPPSALAVPPPCIGGATTPWAAAMDPDANAPPLVPAVPPPLVGGHGNTSLPPPLSPMVLPVLPLWGSSTPIGFIYDATLTRTGVSWPRHWHSFPTKATKSSTTLALILPSIVGPWACWRWQSSPLIAFPIISSRWVWSSCWSCVPRLQPTPNLWAQCSWLCTSSQQPLARLWLGALKLVRQWGVFRFLCWRRLGETLLHLWFLKSVCLWGSSRWFICGGSSGSFVSCGSR
jgi:hypothetical protein